jgi:predicted house-cleaning NTP pyrophosphatase (Maf/HAM1 superfamily)
MLLTLEEVVKASHSPNRRQILEEHALQILEIARRTVDDSELPQIERVMDRLTAILSFTDKLDDQPAAQGADRFEPVSADA